MNFLQSFRFLLMALTLQIASLHAAEVSQLHQKAISPLSIDVTSMALKKELRLGSKGEVSVKIYELTSGKTLTRRAENLTIDMTPAVPTSMVCYPGVFDAPSVADCDKVWVAQLYNSTGSLTAFGGTVVYVNYGTCAVVFQNPTKTAPAIQFNWAMLGQVGRNIANRCLPADTKKSIGGVAFFAKYLTYTFDDVLISVQKHVQGQ